MIVKSSTLSTRVKSRLDPILQAGVFIYNLRNFGYWMKNMAVSGYTTNPDGLQGGANLVRYFIESLHITRPLNDLCTFVTGWSPAAGLEKLHAAVVVPVFGHLGSANAFKIACMP